MDEPLTSYAVELRYPICPACKADLRLPPDHGTSMSCTACGLELRLSQPGVEDEPTAYYIAAIRRRRQRKPAPRINGPADVHLVLAELIAEADREHFYVFLLGTKNHVIAVELVSVGSLSASIVHPREVLKPAVRQSAAAIIVAHNHPSGDPTPSPEDIEFTKRLARCGELFGIRLLDHVIVGADSYISLKEGGHF